MRDEAFEVDRGNDRHAASSVTDVRSDLRAAPAEVADQPAEHAEPHRLPSLLTRIPGPQREVFALAYYGKLTHTEIATQLGLPPGIVKGRMRLGLHRLREHLQRGPTA